MDTQIIDINCDCGPFAFREHPVTSAAEVSANLKHLGISRVVIGSASAITFVSPQPANESLAAELTALGEAFLLPAAVLNPEYPGAEADLQRCAEMGFKVLKLYPTYHSFDLAGYEALRLMEQAGELGWPVLVNVRVEDERHHHPLMQVPALDLAAAVTAARNVPEVNLVLCSANNAEIARFLGEVARENVYAELSWIKGPLNATEDLVERVGSKQLLFGSHLPFSMPQTALAKVKEAFISDEQKADILYRNASRILQ
jgi:uncharacterized protein